MFTFVLTEAVQNNVTMVNNKLVANRLQEIMDFYQLNASALAEKLAIQRSSISHILSGRNKPSLDFILKVIMEFPEVDFYWLLLGKGSFPKSKETYSLPRNEEINFPEPEKETPLPLPSSINSSTSEIEKIVLFYKDGTFSDFNPK